MFGIEPWQLALVSAAICFGGVVKGVTGIGLPIVTISILVNFLDPLVSIAVVVVPILVTNGWQAFRQGLEWSTCRRFAPMIVCFLVVLLASARLVVELDARVLFGVLGVTVTAFAASNLFKPRPRALKPKTERWAGPLAGTLGGVLGGMTTIWGPPMMMYFVLLKLDKDAWVRVVGLVWFAGSLPLTYAYWQNGMLNADTAPLSAYACVPGMAGILIGEHIRKFVDQPTFTRILLVALLLIGINLVRRAVF